MYEPTAYDWKQYRDAAKAARKRAEGKPEELAEYVPNPDEIRAWKIRLNAEKGLDGPPPAPVMDWESLEHILECEVDDG